MLGAGATSVEGSTDADRGTVAASFPGHATPILSSRCVWANVAEVLDLKCDICTYICTCSLILIPLSTGGAVSMFKQQATPSCVAGKESAHCF